MQFKNITLFVILFSFWGYSQQSAHQIIPKPVKIIDKTGSFTLDSKVRINAVKELTNEKDYLTGLLNKGFKTDMAVQPLNHQPSINLIINPDISNKEGYTLEITPEKIEISGKTPTGVFYGIQSLRQLLPVRFEVEKSFDKVQLPAVFIEDYPRYVYRGMHLDVGRHLFPLDFIKKYIDLIALHKMNTFHWHLTEDQGWRLEIKKYPKLTEVGAFRKETLVGHGATKKKNRKFDGKPYGGFYTQEEAKEIVAYAAKRHITLIPEIELPGHSVAAIAAYPWLGNTGKQLDVGTRWGVYEQIYAPTERTFKFLEDVLTEVMEIFPSKFIHIGGDEAPKKEWENSKYAQELIKKEGLKDEHELQSYFIQRIEKFLNKHGRNIIGWDEILEGGLAPNATVMSWRGIKGGIEAAKQHHNVIMTPGSHCYFDHYQVPENERNNVPLAIGGYLPLKKVYSYEPTPEELAPEQQKYILGAQGNVWTEYMKTPDYVEYMILPRMTALSEVVWSQKNHRNWNDFEKRLNTLVKRFEAQGLIYARHGLKK